MKIPKKAKRQIKKELKNNRVAVGSPPRKKVVYAFNEGDLVTTNPKDHEFKDTSSICLVLDYSDGEYLTVWRPTGAFTARSASVRIIQRA
jgi:hypothetical protein